ncbi:MAG: J domain-containing protein [Gammaproteobacteria bacterium]
MRSTTRNCNQRIVSSISIGFHFVSDTLKGIYQLLGLNEVNIAIRTAPTGIRLAAHANSRALINYGIKGAVIGYFYGSQMAMFYPRAFTITPLLGASVGSGFGLAIGARYTNTDPYLSASNRPPVVSKGILQDILDGFNSPFPEAQQLGFYHLAGMVVASIETFRIEMQFEIIDKNILFICQAIAFLLSTLAALNASRMLIDKKQTLEQQSSQSSHRFFNKSTKRNPTISASVMSDFRQLQEARVNPYELLGVAQNATEKEINSAYRKASLRAHPDKNASCPSKFHLLTSAKNVLLDGIARMAIHNSGLSKHMI